VRVALDTNVLAYAEGTNGPEMKEAALRLIHRLPVSSVVLPVQALGETVQRAGAPSEAPGHERRAAILGWRDAYPAIDTSSAVMLSAADLATDHRLRIWDAVILSASAEAGCRLLLSEDLQEGFTWRGVTVTNPFADTPHALLRTLVGDDERDEVQEDDT
jgi:predicted nucleic acid-binding protein